MKGPENSPDDDPDSGTVVQSDDAADPTFRDPRGDAFSALPELPGEGAACRGFLQDVALPHQVLSRHSNLSLDGLPLVLLLDHLASRLHQCSSQFRTSEKGHTGVRKLSGIITYQYVLAIGHLEAFTSYGGGYDRPA